MSRERPLTFPRTAGWAMPAGGVEGTPANEQTKISCGRRGAPSIFFGPSICHGRVGAGKGRGETRGKVNNGI